jgi:hypothetical protein
MKSAEDLKKNHFDYYVQVQIEIMALKKEKALFVSYDPRCSEKLQMKILEIPRDEEMIKEILYRKEEALKELNSIMAEMVEMVKTVELNHFKISA